MPIMMSRSSRRKISHGLSRIEQDSDGRRRQGHGYSVPTPAKETAVCNGISAQSACTAAVVRHHGKNTNENENRNQNRRASSRTRSGSSRTQPKQGKAPHIHLICEALGARENCHIQVLFCPVCICICKDKPMHDKSYQIKVGNDFPVC
jgi:hypothetical protein